MSFYILIMIYFLERFSFVFLKGKLVLTTLKEAFGLDYL